MNKFLISIIVLILLKYEICLSQKQNWPSITLINKVEFFDSSYNNNNAACGFLLRFENDTFAITAKHVLFVAKTDSMHSVHFRGYLKRWTMLPKDKANETVVMNKLINEDKSDSLHWKNLDNDWLVFSIKENNSKVTPLEIRRRKLKYGEPLYVVGWTYMDNDGEQRVYRYSYMGPNGSHFSMKLVDAPMDGNGLSGSPVIDSEGFLVGIISYSYFDPETRTMISSPCGISGLIDILTKK